MVDNIETIEYNEKGEHRFVDGKLHRVNGPAYIGKDTRWGWWIRDKRHRYYGSQNHTGAWWVNGRIVKA